MHYLYYVAVPKKEVKSSKEAKRLAVNVLESNNFVGDGGFWSSSPADWFVVGGRWSGKLQAVQMKGLQDKFDKIISKNKADKDVEHVTDSDIKQNTDALQKLWEKLGGTGKHYWNRDNYNPLGEEDDCMVLTKKLFNALTPQTPQKKGKMDTLLGHETEIAIIDDCCVLRETTLDTFLKIDNIIGNYYLVVIDYHN